MTSLSRAILAVGLYVGSIWFQIATGKHDYVAEILSFILTLLVLM